MLFLCYVDQTTLDDSGSIKKSKTKYLPKQNIAK